MKTLIFKMKKTGRVCYQFPWGSTKGAAARPWKDGYERVIIPLSESEKKFSNPSTTCHIQVMRRENLEIIKENKLQLG